MGLSPRCMRPNCEQVMSLTCCTESCCVSFTGELIAFIVLPPPQNYSLLKENKNRLPDITLVQQAVVACTVRSFTKIILFVLQNTETKARLLRLQEYFVISHCDNCYHRKLVRALY